MLDHAHELVRRHSKSLLSLAALDSKTLEEERAPTTSTNTVTDVESDVCIDNSGTQALATGAVCKEQGSQTSLQ